MHDAMAVPDNGL